MTLPWWLPTDWIKQYLAAEMSEQMGVAVEIDDAQISWDQGLRLEGVRIYSPESFNQATMAEIREIRTDFSPISTLLSGKIEWMEILHPRLYIRVDQQGKTNIAPLEMLEFDFQAKRISVTEAVGIVTLNESPGPVQINIHDMQLLEGRATRFGRITLSGSVEQTPTPAPLTGRVDIQQQADRGTASMAFGFSGLDLDQLLLRQLLNLPLRRLDGAASGSVNLRLNRDGIVDQFSLAVNIANLDAQPIEGPSLPIVENAGIELSATYDPITQVVDIEQLGLRLPGLDLKGKGRVYDELALGQLEAIESLELTGSVQPVQMMGFLTGQSLLPGDVLLEWPVLVQLKIRHEDSTIHVQASANADQARVAREGKVIKPAGRTLRGHMVAALDDRVWRLEMAESSLTIGRNVFAGAGRIDDLRPLLETDYTDRDQLDSLAETLAGSTQWQGQVRLVEPDDLAELSEPLGRLLGPASIEAPVRAEFAYSGPQRRLNVLAGIPQVTALRYGRHFQQQDGQDLQLAISGRLSPGQASLTDGSLTVSLNKQPAVRLSRLQLLCPAGPTGPLEVSGRLWLGQVQQLRRMLPALDDQLEGVSGSAEVRFDLSGSDGAWRGRVSADLSELAIDRPGLPEKPTRRRRNVDILTAELSTESRSHAINARAELRSQSDRLELQARWTDLDALAANRLDFLLLQGRLEDIRRLVPESAIAGVGSLSGPLSGRLELRRDRTRWTWQVEAESGALRIAATEGLLKPLSLPVKLGLEGSVEATGPERWQIELSRAQLNLAEGVVDLSASGQLALAGVGSIDETTEPADLLDQADLVFELQADAGKLAQFAEHHLVGWQYSFRPTGRLRGKTKLQLDGGRLRAEVQLDAADVHWPVTKLGELTGLAMIPKSTRGRLGPLRLSKPAQVPAELRARLEADLAEDTWRLEDLAGRLGPISATWQAQASDARAGRLSLWTASGGQLAQLLPDLEDLELSGSAWLSARLHVGKLQAEYLQLRFDEFQAELAGKEVSLDGELRSWGLSLADGEAGPVLGRVETDGLGVRIGENRMWLLGQLRDLPRAASGRIEILATDLDDGDLLEWAMGLGRQLDLRAAEPPESQAVARSRAAEQLKLLAGLAKNADLSVRLHASRYTNYDSRVRRSHQLREVELSAELADSVLDLRYDASLSEGKYIARHSVDLSKENPVIENRLRMRDILASEQMQPQLAMYFPGNTVLGYFSRSEVTHLDLTAMLAGLTDVRYRPAPVGEAITITTDGYVIGQAAPGFITRIFPGLNLARYRYRKMTGFANFLPDGSAENDMIFDGETYDVYMEGTTEPDNRVNYQVGLLALGAQGPQWHHAWRQGRLPILKVTGRIVDGRMEDQEVTFPWPDETLGAVFVRNSIFYRMWVNWNGSSR